MKNHSYTFAQRMQNEHVLLTFEMLADLHITLPKRNKTLDNALEDIWLRKSKTTLIAGDLCSHGFLFQIQQCLEQLKEYPLHYLIALGNHDTYSMKEKEQIHIHPLYKELALKKHHQLFYDEWINGFHFYILNSEKPCKNNAYFSHQQLYWLKENLEKDNKKQPAFVLCHEPLKNTHSHSDKKELSLGFQSSNLQKILSTHPNTIFLSAHIHNSYEVSSPRFDYPIYTIDIPSFSQTTYGEKRKEIGLQVQVYHDFMYLRTRDYKNHCWILSHEFILDLVQQEIYSFDIDLLLPNANR